MRINLRDKDTSPTTSQFLVVATDPDTGAPVWRETRTQIIPPKQSEGALKWSHFDPLVDFVWSMDDFSGGAFQTYYREDEPNKYALADGVDARFAGVLAPQLAQLGPSVSRGREGSSTYSVVIENPGAELNDNEEWTDGAFTNSISSTQANSGTYSFKIVTSGSGSTGDNLVSQAVVFNAGVFQGNTFTVICFMYRETVGGSTVKLTIDDGVDTTSSSTFNTDAAWTSISVTHTVNGSGTKFDIIAELQANESIATTFYLDDFNFGRAAMDGEKVFLTRHNDTVGSAYMAQGPFIFKFDGETKDHVWDLVSYSGNDTHVATDMAFFEGNIFVAYGTARAYLYGSSTTWTASNLGTTLQEAYHFVATENSDGTWAMWKDETGIGDIKNSVDPKNGGTAWGAAVQAGTTSSTATKMVAAFGTLIVCKDEGIFVFTQRSGITSILDNTFQNIWPEMQQRAPGGGGTIGTGLDFKSATLWRGWLYLDLYPMALWRWRPGQFQDLSYLLEDERLGNRINHIKALYGDEDYLWILLAESTGVVFETNSALRLCTLNEPRGQLVVHQIYKLSTLNQSVQDFAAMSIGPGRSSERTLLHIAMDVDSQALEFFQGRSVLTGNTSFNMCRQGSLTTSIWHGNAPGVQKAFIALTTCTANLQANRPLIIKFGLDGAAASSTTLATVTANGVQTQYFESLTTPLTGAVGNEIQLEFNLQNNSGGTTVPQLFWFTLHAVLRPDKLRQYETEVIVDDDVPLPTGLPDPQSKTTLRANLNTLENQVYPIRLWYTSDDTWNESDITKVSVTIVDVERVQTDDRSERYRLILQESKTSA